MSLTIRAEHRLFGGRQLFIEHQSAACAGPMRFGIYLPPAAEREAVPVLYFLAGLTCTEETFFIKAGAQRTAAELGIALVAPDTSPRASRFPGDDASWDFGLAAGFYLDATEKPWSEAYRMERYVTQELRALVEESFPIREGARGIFGHSMGGHGALMLSLRHPELYRSVSAFAPIAAPSEVPWGQKAFAGYLGPDRTRWEEHDSAALLRKGKRFPSRALVDQGTADEYLERELRPELLGETEVELRLHEGYDHYYFFIATFVEDHLRHHARHLT